MIEVQDLTKYYGNFAALKGISFTVEKGEVVGFLGPNGAGKTTTMRILTAYMPPSAGKVTVAGYDVVDGSMEVRRVIGYMPETVPLYPDMSVFGYLDFVAELRGVPDRWDRIEDVLDRVGMLERADSLIRNLSKGMRQRVGLAQAIIHDPEVLILDEPTIGLDPRQVLEVRQLVRELGRDHTIIFSTHILSEAEQVCDRVLIIDHGQIVAEGTPQNLRDRLQKGGRLFVRVGRADGDVEALLRKVPTVREVTSAETGFIISADDNVGVRPAIARAVVEAGWDLLELRPLAMTLEDIFLELTASDEDTAEPEPEEE